VKDRSLGYVLISERPAWRRALRSEVVCWHPGRSSINSFATPSQFQSPAASRRQHIKHSQRSIVTPITS
jgi:hypothetical protein